MIGHGLWQRAFGGDPAIVGKKVTLNTMPVTVVGVMPPTFGFPDDDTEAWVPARIDPADPGWAATTINAIARSDGVAIGEARGEIDPAHGMGQGDGREGSPARVEAPPAASCSR